MMRSIERLSRQKQCGLFAAVGFVVYFYLGYKAIVTPVEEIHEILPFAVINALSGAPARPACGPCGCPAAGEQGTRFCIDDDELAHLSSLDKPLHPAAAASEATLVRTFLHDRLDTEDCYGVLRALHASLSRAQVSSGLQHPRSSRGHVLWHWYVRRDLRAEMTKAQLDAVASWLSTQDIERSTLIIWLPLPYTPPPSLLVYAALFPGRIRWRQLHVLWEAEGTPLARSYLLRLRDSKAWVDSDIARLVILWKYGGVWLDTDMLLVRSITPLLGLEFATEFSCNHSQAGFNNAVMRFFPRGKAITGMCEMAKREWPRVRLWTYGPYLLEDAHEAGVPIARLPWCFFHALWCPGSLVFDDLELPTKWDHALVLDIWGLHMHGAGSKGRAVHNASVLGLTEGRTHAALLERVRARDPAGPAAQEWEAERRRWMLFPPGFTHEWQSDL